MTIYDPIESWIATVQSTHSPSPNTASRYRRQMHGFCDFIGKKAQQILEDYDRLPERQFRRIYARYLRAWINEKASEGCTSGSVSSNATTVRSFFKYNDLPLGFVPKPQVRVVYHNRDLTKVELSAILHASKLRDKAFFYIMAQGGLRPDTITKLKYKDIEEELEAGTVPMLIKVPQGIAKGQYGSYFTFIGEEAVKYLRLYLEARPNIQPDDYLFLHFKLNKQTTPKGFSKVFAKIIKKLEKSKVLKVERLKFGKPADLRLYNLRKFFRKYAGQAGVEYANFWMGHKTNYRAPHIPSSDAHYFDTQDIEFHRQIYEEKAMPYLKIEGATPYEKESNFKQLHQKIEELEKKNLELKQRLNGFTLSNDQVQELLHRIETLEKKAQKQT